MSDMIRLKDITVFGFYGVSPQEREVGQKIQIDLDLYADLSGACASDSLQDTINYESVYSSIMRGFPVSRVDIRLRKLNLPFPNNLAHVEIHLAREAPCIEDT